MSRFNERFEQNEFTGALLFKTTAPMERWDQYDSKMRLEDEFNSLSRLTFSKFNLLRTLGDDPTDGIPEYEYEAMIRSIKIIPNSNGKVAQQKEE